MRRPDLVNCYAVRLIVPIAWGNHLPAQRKIPEPVAPTREVAPVGSADRVSYRWRPERARQDTLPNVLGYPRWCVHSQGYQQVPQRSTIARYAAKGLNRLGRQAHPPIFQVASKSGLMHRSRAHRLLKGLSDLASPVFKRFLVDAARAPGAPGPEASMRCQVRSFVF